MGSEELQEKERYETLYMKEQLELPEQEEHWLLAQIRHTAASS